ncbi:MAG: VOC family protein [Methanomassiliicoccales archaeon]
MDPVRSFNLPVDDMARAVKFYDKAFGWKVGAIEGSGGDYHHAITCEVDEAGIPLSKDAINGGLFRRGTHGIDVTFLELEVSSIDESFQKVLESGGRIVREKRPMLDFAYFAIVQDTEGNYLGLMEYRK